MPCFSVWCEANFNVRRGAEIAGFFRPLHQANGSAVKVLFQAGIVPLFWMIESIKIKVIQTIPRNYVKFNQCVSRALHRAGVAKCAQQAAHQGGLPRTQLAMQMDHKSRREYVRQRGAQQQRGRFVGQLPVRLMMRRMILR